MNNQSDELGAFLIKYLRDQAIDTVSGLSENRYNSPGHKAHQEKISEFTTEQKQLLIETVGYCMDNAINVFLFNLNKENSLSKTISEEDKVNIFQNKNPVLSYKKWKEMYSQFPLHY